MCWRRSFFTNLPSNVYWYIGKTAEEEKLVSIVKGILLYSSLYLHINSPHWLRVLFKTQDIPCSLRFSSNAAFLVEGQTFINFPSIENWIISLAVAILCVFKYSFLIFDNFFLDSFVHFVELTTSPPILELYPLFNELNNWIYSFSFYLVFLELHLVYVS